MRLKEIKPGMVIHCKTKEELEELSKYVEFKVDIEHIWNYGNDGIRRDCIFINDDGRYGGFDTYRYFAIRDNTITEFSDLILPELTPEEILRVFGEICACVGCSRCPFDRIKDDFECPTFLIEHYKEAAEICAKWKADHEKKEPEIEWVYRVFGAENFGEKFFQTEDEAIKRCEELAKSQKTKQYARYERVCRVKAVE